MLFSGSWDGTSTSVGLACREGNSNVLQRLLACKRPVNRMDNRGWRPIHEAAAGNHVECLALLLRNGKSDLKWTTHEGETALILAVVRCHLEAVTQLLDAGSDPNTRNNEDDSVLHLAIQQKNTQIVEALLNAGALINAVNLDGETALHLATDENSDELVSLLLSRGASLSVKDGYGRTPLFKAASNGAITFIQQFINKIKSMGESVLIDMGPRDGTTSLMMAAQIGCVESTELLIKAGADVNSVARDGVTAIHLAAFKGHFSCVKVLYPLMSQELKERTCQDNYTCIQHLAVNSRWCNIEIVKYLYDSGQDPNMCLASLRKPSLILLNDVLTFFAYCKCADCEDLQISVLTVAVDRRYHECALEIIRRGGFINTPNRKILSPLYLAVIFDNYEMVKLLLNHGANPNTPHPAPCKMDNHFLRTAIENPAILVELLKAGFDIRLYFTQPLQPLLLLKIQNDAHINCLNVIVNTFSGKQMNILYKDVEDSWSFVILDQCDDRNATMVNYFKAKPTISHCKCNDLVSGIDSMSLQHMCRVRVVQTILEANNWAPLHQRLENISVHKIITDLLLYKYV